jgi:hypothetical protein
LGGEKNNLEAFLRWLYFVLQFPEQDSFHGKIIRIFFPQKILSSVHSSDSYSLKNFRVRGGGIVYIFKLSAHAEQKAREIQIFFGKAYKRDFAGTGCRGVGVLFARFVK